jgi:hypothetical protein
MDTLTIEYRNTVDGLRYVQFDANLKLNKKDKKVQLFCCDDPTGRHDRIILKTDLKRNYREIKRYMEES